LRFATEIAVYQRYEIGPWLLWNVNTKMADRHVSVPMTLSDPNPGFKVTVFLLTSQISQKRVLGSQLLQNINRKLHPIYRMGHFQWPWV